MEGGVGLFSQNPLDNFLIFLYLRIYPPHMEDAMLQELDDLKKEEESTWFEFNSWLKSGFLIGAGYILESTRHYWRILGILEQRLSIIYELFPHKDLEQIRSKLTEIRDLLEKCRDLLRKTINLSLSNEFKSNELADVDPSVLMKVYVIPSELSNISQKLDEFEKALRHTLSKTRGSERLGQVQGVA